MELTAFGFVLLPLSLIFMLRPGRLLQITLLASGVGAAVSVLINFRGEAFGLPGGFLPALFFIGVIALDCLSRPPQEGDREAVRAVMPLVLFTACAIAGAVVLPRLFAGQITVWPQRPGGLLSAIPLMPNGGNVTQSLYLIVNTAFLVLTALYVSRPGTRQIAFVHAYLLSGYLVVGLVLWQLASKLIGIYYPEEFLYSNPSWAILTEQAFGDVHRLNGPFAEPAALASYLSGIIFACLWILLRGQGGFSVRLLLLLSLLGQLLSTATTGIVILTVFVPAILLRAATRREGQAFGFLTLAGAIGGALMLGVIAYLAVPSLVSPIEKAASTVIEATLEKPESDSYADRTTKDIESIGVLAPTYGLGAGWGSVRSSSLIPGLLANSGILGLVLLGWFAARSAGLVARARRLAPSGDARLAMDAMAGSVLGTLCAALLSGPTIDEIDFFLRLAVMIGCAVRIWLDAQSRSTAPAVTATLPGPLPAGSPRTAP